MTKDIVTRAEFEALKDAFLRLKDVLAECNLKVNANFDDIDLDDDLDDIDLDDDMEVKDGELTF